MKANAKLERQVAAIGDLSREELVALWEKQYGCPPPKGIKRGLLERSAAWHLQARRLGGLSPTAKRILKAAEKEYLSRQGDANGSASPRPDSEPRLGMDAGIPAKASDPVNVGQAMTAPVSQPVTSSSQRPASTVPARPAPIVFSPGTRLLREWNGRMYAVDVLDKGFVMDGKTYRSLSAIAKRITGAEWSGPRFFGL